MVEERSTSFVGKTKRLRIILNRPGFILFGVEYVYSGRIDSDFNLVNLRT